jgi:replicative DNA helicase
MITSQYIDSCFTVILNKKTKIRKDQTLYRDILESLLEYKKQEKKDIPINVQNKLDCLIKICELKSEDKTNSNVIDSISMSEKFKPLLDFINVKIDEDVHDQIILDNIKQIRLRKKLASLLCNYESLGSFLQTIKEGSFSSIDDVVLDYENIIKNLYITMMDNNRSTSIEASCSLDMTKDDYGSVTETILRKYQRTNKVSSGFPILDEILDGGFEPSRLYIFGGGSSAGKSTLMNNMMFNAASTKAVEIIERKDETKKVFVCITLENTIDESLLRIYQALFHKRKIDALRDLSQLGKDKIKEDIMNELEKNNSTIVIKYFPAKTISVLDIMSVLDDIISGYGKNSIKCLYVDYLDTLKSDINYDIYRIELGDITLALKSLAVEYDIPVVTATQLGRSVYRIQDSQSLNLDQVGESIKKVEHSDFVGLLSKDPVDETIVHFKVAKNRSGKANVALDFKVDFTIFKFKNIIRLSNKNKSTVVTDDTSGFGGIGPSY